VNLTGEPDLEAQIAQWRAYLGRRRELGAADVDELEDHLRSRIAELGEAGLDPGEAFLIALKRLGSLDDVSREFAREHSERLWKQMVLPAPPAADTATGARRDLVAVVLAAAVAALSIKIPALFGVELDSDADAAFYARNLSLFPLPALAAWFAWRRAAGARVIAVLVGSFVLGAVFANAYPLPADSQSLALTAIHLPIALWLVVGVAYVGGDWRSGRRRMDFIRFTGEWLIYFALLGLGGAVLTAITAGTFEAIGVDAEAAVTGWLLPCGAMAAVVVAAWLVEAKQSVVENMAPVLTRIFTPLFTAVLSAFLVAVVWTTSGVDVDRDALILFDLLLAVVLGLLLYGLSARDPQAAPGLFDRLQLALVVSALVIDALVLVAMTGRITEFGLTPNKSAALGENIVLLVNLAGSAGLFLGFLRGRAPFSRLDRWQTGYVVVYAAWAWAVVIAFPPLFDFA
jgi:hypothetical protein